MAINRTTPDPRMLISEVQQGSVLGPLLFTLNIADVGKKEMDTTIQINLISWQDKIYLVHCPSPRRLHRQYTSARRHIEHFTFLGGSHCRRHKELHVQALHSAGSGKSGEHSPTLPPCSMFLPHWIPPSSTATVSFTVFWNT